MVEAVANAGIPIVLDGKVLMGTGQLLAVLRFSLRSSTTIDLSLLPFPGEAGRKKGAP